MLFAVGDVSRIHFIVFNLGRPHQSTGIQIVMCSLTRHNNLKKKGKNCTSCGKFALGTLGMTVDL